MAFCQRIIPIILSISLSKNSGLRRARRKGKSSRSLWFGSGTPFSTLRRSFGLNDQERDITSICAETRARESEILDFPEEDIHLKHPIPHICLEMVESGEHKRQLKNLASKRQIVLLWHALDAMRRNSRGFPEYRGNPLILQPSSIFSENKLFPDTPKRSPRNHTIGGLSSFLRGPHDVAGLTNDERGLLMGHSIETLRGRPVYGTKMQLRVRALLAEKVVFPTATWAPRLHEEIDGEINILLEEQGFRTR